MTKKKKILLPGYRRGNTTSGANRRGNRDGRKPIYTDGTETYSIALVVSESEYAAAMVLGTGKAAQGAREALRRIIATLPPGMPQTRAEAYEWAVIERRKRSAASKAASRMRLQAQAQAQAQAQEPTHEWDDV